MASQPLVSIIVPAYRAEGTIAFTIRSVLQQTYDRWQVAIGVDDQVDYLQLLAQQGIDDPRLKQVFTGGMGSGEAIARNKAVSICDGDILANLDADDAFAPDRLERLVPLVEEYGVAIDNTGVYNSELVLYKQPFPQRRELSFATAADILSPRIPFFPVFQRRFLGNGWTKVPFAADVLFNLELLSRTEKVAIHPEPLYRYYKRDNSITQSANAFETAEKAYLAILSLLDQGALTLTPSIRQAARQEFSENLALNKVFRRYMEEGRCQNLEQFLDMTNNGRQIIGED
ncbi:MULTISPECIES: glycosyltransferase family 2 protein [unclassified Synechocystis]|uniref:glycosyltransferase family 2 protein n=1 Tax=unclassified Synechocystis TaxID=2640012 RepID=UPI00048D1E25|nr:MULTISPECIES: glycosyltransferase family 2 protein [unclassified Synechocystis]MCT0252682.1 glycosyltransferase [Synechocystis sp. CS-94]